MTRISKEVRVRGTVLKTNVDLERAKLIPSALAAKRDTIQPIAPRGVSAKDGAAGSCSCSCREMTALNRRLVDRDSTS